MAIEEITTLIFISCLVKISWQLFKIDSNSCLSQLTFLGRGFGRVLHTDFGTLDGSSPNFGSSVSASLAVAINTSIHLSKNMGDKDKVSNTIHRGGQRGNGSSSW